MADVRWTGAMLDTPAGVTAYCNQMHTHLLGLAEEIRRVRLDAVSLWQTQRPKGVGAVEARARHLALIRHYAALERRVRRAAVATRSLDAAYQHHRHEVPERRQAAQEAKARPAAGPQRLARPVERRPPAARLTSPRRPKDAPSFADLLNDSGERSA
jgi:hypothetical protein